MANNQEQIDYWNGTAGNNWVEQQQVMDAMLAPIGAALLEGVKGRPGERALDVGCGCGDTSVQLAEKGLKVTGIDISAPMLNHARTRVVSGQTLQFVEGDAAAQSFSGDYDVVLSRFGVMFFDDPVAAFRNLHTALNPQGRLCIACWQPPIQNPWIAVPMATARPFLPPADPVDPLAPGPFSLADPEHVTQILTSAGYTNVRVEPVLRKLNLGVDLAHAMAFVERIGPMSGVLKDLSEQELNNARTAVREALAAYETSAGVVLDAAGWLVQATAS